MYRTIDCEFWTDEKVRALSNQETLLFLYLITNPHSHYSGLYALSMVIMQYESKLKGGFERIFQGLQDRDMIRYVTAFEQVWVKNMFAHQAKGRKCEKGVATHLMTLHRSPLVFEFLSRYPNVKTYCDDTLLIPYPSPIDRGSSSPSPDILISSLNSPDPDLKSTKYASNGRDYQSEAKEVLQFLNVKSDKHFRETPINLNFIIGRLKGDAKTPAVDTQTCKSLIARKVRDWKGDAKMDHCLRPETLFNKTKFESYLAEVTP